MGKNKNDKHYSVFFIYFAKNNRLNKTGWRWEINLLEGQMFSFSQSWTHSANFNIKTLQNGQDKTENMNVR